jgi:hypothetical protein
LVRPESFRDQVGPRKSLSKLRDFFYAFTCVFNASQSRHFWHSGRSSHRLRNRTESYGFGIVIANNYPRGNLDASEEDLKLTKRIKEAGELLDGQLIDHLILGIDDDYSSFTEKGWF